MPKDIDGILGDSHWQHQVLDYGLWTDQVFCIGIEPHPR